MKIGQKLNLSFAFLALLMASVSGISLLNFFNEIKRDALNTIEYERQLFNILKNENTRALSAALEVFQDNPAYKRAFLNRDRESL